jgi:hypothetical protein
MTIPDFKLYYRAIVTKNSMVLAQNRYKDQWSTIKEPDTKPCRYSHLIFNKEVQNIC